MTALQTRRTPLCLFCTFARSRPQPRRLLPQIQIAHRTSGIDGTNKAFATNYGPHRGGYRHERDLQEGNIRLDRTGKNSFNPLKTQKFNGNRDAGRSATSLFETVRTKLAKLRTELAQPEFLESLELTREAFDQEWLTFERSINLWVKQATPELTTLAQEATRGRKGLETRMRYLFYAQTCGGRFTKAELKNQKEVADLRYPTEWYPATRELSRTVHLHVGPTNSGKTYHALKRLEEADKGIYLGPLRLLAHEVYTRLNAKGKPCALVTGEEQRMPEDEIKMWSCTVEMAPLNMPLDVAVIDEIQMINHKDRGWAWTQAFLGVQAREVHLCGEARTVPLIRQLCALVGDTVHIHEYKRLTPLQVAPRSLRGQLDNLEKGDCVVSFSVLGIHALRRQIEKKTGKNCAIVYGSLPPETRAQQARLFNDPDNDYDFLVASDAIGMGLNLSIKRVIFETTVKSNGTRLLPLQISEIKQIAGRAGRYKTAHQALTEDNAEKTESQSTNDPNTGVSIAESEIKPAVAPTVGLVTTLEQLDFEYLKSGMSREPEAITTAGIFPPSLIVERFASYFPPGTPFSYIMLRLHEISEIHPRFHLCALKDQLAIADAIHTVKSLSISDRIVICAAPCNTKNEGEKQFLRTLAESIADGKSGELLDLPNLPLEILDEPPSSERKYLWNLEQLHKMIVTYLWLSYRFPNVFTNRNLAEYTKKLTEDAIERTLMDFSWTKQAMAKMRKLRQAAMREAQDEDQQMPEAESVPGLTDTPQEVVDVLKDTRSFNEESTPADDEGEYPMPELGVLEPSATEKLEALEK